VVALRQPGAEVVRRPLLAVHAIAAVALAEPEHRRRLVRRQQRIERPEAVRRRGVGRCRRAASVGPGHRAAATMPHTTRTSPTLTPPPHPSGLRLHPWW